MIRVLNLFRVLNSPVTSSHGQVIRRAAQPAILLPVGDQLAGAVTYAPALFGFEGGFSPVQLGESRRHGRGEGNNGFSHFGVVARSLGQVMRQNPASLIHQVGSVAPW